MNILFIGMLGLGGLGTFFLGKKALKAVFYTKEELVGKIYDEQVKRRIL